MEQMQCENFSFTRDGLIVDTVWQDYEFVRGH